MNRYKNCIGGALQGVEGGAREAGGVLEGLPARERQDVPMTQSQRSVNTNTNANTIQRWLKQKYNTIKTCNSSKHKKWPTDGATFFGSKFGHQVAPLALVINLSTRWRHLH